MNVDTGRADHAAGDGARLASDRHRKGNRRAFLPESRSDRTRRSGWRHSLHRHRRRRVSRESSSESRSTASRSRRTLAASPRLVNPAGVIDDIKIKAPGDADIVDAQETVRAVMRGRARPSPVAARQLRDRDVGVRALVLDGHQEQAGHRRRRSSGDRTGRRRDRHHEHHARRRRRANARDRDQKGARRATPRHHVAVPRRSRDAEHCRRGHRNRARNRCWRR